MWHVAYDMWLVPVTHKESQKRSLPFLRVWAPRKAGFCWEVWFSGWALKNGKEQGEEEGEKESPWQVGEARSWEAQKFNFLS